MGLIVVVPTTSQDVDRIKIVQPQRVIKRPLLLIDLKITRHFIVLTWTSRCLQILNFFYKQHENIISKKLKLGKE